MKAKLFTAFICLTVGVSIPPLSAADKAVPKETKVVIATGVSTNTEKARLSAYRNAVQQVVGVIVDAKTLIENNKVIKDKILDFSNGFVEKFEIIKEGENDDGLYEITIRATVKQRQLIERLEAMKMTTGPVTPEPLPSGGGAALSLKKTLKALDLPDSLLKVNAVKPKPDILNTTENEPRLVKLEWVFEIQFDQDKYRKVVLPKLKQVLDSIDIATKKIKFELHHSVPLNKPDSFGKDWNKLGVYEYLFGFWRYQDVGPAEFAGRLPRAGKDRYGREIQSNNKPVAGGVPVFLMEDWQHLTGLRTYTVYWVDLESAKVLKDYLRADIALQLDLSGPGKKALFSETIRFNGHMNSSASNSRGPVDPIGEGVIMRGPNPTGVIGNAQRQAQILSPTFIYSGRSEFIDDSSLLDKTGPRFTLAPYLGGVVNTISIMPLMHLGMNVGKRGRPVGGWDLRGVTEVAKYSWQPLVPLTILKDLTQISCSFVNAGKQ
jgi:hypothetical protein